LLAELRITFAGRTPYFIRGAHALFVTFKNNVHRSTRPTFVCKSKVRCTTQPTFISTPYSYSRHTRFIAFKNNFYHATPRCAVRFTTLTPLFSGGAFRARCLKFMPSLPRPLQHGVRKIACHLQRTFCPNEKTVFVSSTTLLFALSSFVFHPTFNFCQDTLWPLKMGVKNFRTGTMPMRSQHVSVPKLQLILLPAEMPSFVRLRQDSFIPAKMPIVGVRDTLLPA